MNEKKPSLQYIAAAEGYDPEEVLTEMRMASSDKMKKRRRHRRKFYREIGFAALTKQIAVKWKALDSAAKIPFDAMAMKEKQRYRNELCKWNEEQKKKNHEVDVNALNAVAAISMTQKSETRDSDKMMLIGDATPSQILYSPYSVQPPQRRCNLSTKPNFDRPSSALDHLNVNMKNIVLPPSNHDENNFGGALQPPKKKQQQSLSEDNTFDVSQKAVLEMGDTNNRDPTPILPCNHQQNAFFPDVRSTCSNKALPTSKLVCEHTTALRMSSFVPSTTSSQNEGCMDLYYSTKQYIDSFDVELEEIIQNCSLFSEFGMHKEYELSP
mmetsp:Transcript_18317/g.23270  ORF Transcript_18317/g.23270 Transcript_18317/m.23270 type:complete len:325 (+) Transcript_18317:340-1314(+)